MTLFHHQINKQEKIKKIKKVEKERVCVPLILLIVVAIAGFAIYEEYGPSLTIDGVSFNIPEGYQLESNKTYRTTIFFKDCTDAIMSADERVYANNEDSICIKVLNPEGDDTFTIEDINNGDIVANDQTTTINGHEGVKFDFDEYEMFRYVENNKLVEIRYSNPDSINEIVRFF